MTGKTLLQDMLGGLIDRGQRLIDRGQDTGAGEGPKPLIALCKTLLSRHGEASGVALAGEIMRGYRSLVPKERLAFFQGLAKHFDPDAEAVRSAAEAFHQAPSSEHLASLVRLAEPPRQELLRRLNMTPNGTAALVAMRRDLLPLLGSTPELGRIDADFLHLFSSWFNRGFLVLRRIDWSTPASILEKIIAYEAVHEIASFDDLRRRLEPSDRRCFAFFHPSMPDEPLIFLEVALCTAVQSSIQAILAEEREEIPAESANTAAFYSISNCQVGLRGVSFGNFLVKQVVEDLAAALPHLKVFSTLSPLPGLMAWLRREAEATPQSLAQKYLSRIEAPAWHEQDKEAERLRPAGLALAADYLLNRKRDSGAPVDPVARFHLGNGASLDRVRWMADLSERGLAQAAGIMVNYRYDRDRLEANHEAFAEERKIAASRAVRSLLPLPATIPG